MRRYLLLIILFSMLILAGGCSIKNGQSAVVTQPATIGTLIVEPDYGPGPYLTAVNGAKYSIDVNSYTLTDDDLVAALIKQATAGVNVRVMVAGNPYEDSNSVAQEQDEFAGTQVQLKLAPRQFEGEYIYDHAKYLIVDSGHDGQAILGSSNMDYSGLGGGNREYGYDTTSPAVIANLESIFNADWNGQSFQLSNPSPLIVSPGSEQKLVSLIQGAKQRLYIESEELGNDWPVLNAIMAAAHRGVSVDVVLPTGVSPDNLRNAEDLSQSGADVRYLSSPYPHAKLIIVDNLGFLGSQNISANSLTGNREVGIVFTGDTVSEAVHWFEQDFAAANNK